MPNNFLPALTPAYNAPAVGNSVFNNPFLAAFFSLDLSVISPSPMPASSGIIILLTSFLPNNFLPALTPAYNAAAPGNIVAKLNLAAFLAAFLSLESSFLLVLYSPV